MRHGMLRALSAAIGESDNEIGGVFYTRLTSVLKTGAPLAAVLTWNGTNIVTTPDTSELVEGDWIRLDSDGRYFLITGIIPNVQCQIDNPTGYPIPSGATASSKAVQSFPVESTLDWKELGGKFAIEGIVYRYASKTLTSFEGVYHLLGGDLIPGPRRQHRVESPVMDLNRDRTAVDQTRRAMLVEYAEGEDLNAIGRNIGVLRLPFLESDERFRSIVKALSYNPRGTMWGLEIALTGLVGAGNFELYEDVIRYPNKVFVRLKGAAATDTRSQGKAFLAGPEFHTPVAANQVNVDYPFIARGTLHGIFWKPEDLFTDTRAAYPTTQFIREYPAASLSQAWRYYGGTEGTHVVLASPGIQFALPAADARYSRQLRVTPFARVEAELVAQVPSGGGVEANVSTVLTLADGGREAALSFRSLGASTFELGIARYTGGVWVVLFATTLSKGSWYTLKLVKQGQSSWEVWVDGRLVLTGSYGGVSIASSARKVTLGVMGSLPVPGLTVKQIQLWSQDNTDLASLFGRTATVVSANQLDIGAFPDFVVGDVGKPFVVSGSGVSNPSGGNNNGRWLVQSVDSPTQVTLDGPENMGAVVNSINPTRVTVSLTGLQFQFPDDLGKTLVISGSVLGNNGAWPIARLLDQGSLVDLASWSTAVPAKTNVCELTGPSFVPEAGLTWKLQPAFVAEAGLRYDMAGAASIVGQTITTRRNLPLFSDINFQRVFGVVYSALLSGQVLLDANVDNEITQEVPDLWFSYYPFYLADPLGFVRIYLDDVTAAGVIPDYLIV